MSDETESKELSKPRLCERCGSRMSPQKRGRPRHWCSQQCRQLAYEERHEIETWKDKQPKIRDLSDVIEATQERSARREAYRPMGQSRGRHGHNSSDCLMRVVGNQVTLALALEFVTDLVTEERLGDTAEGRFLADRVARLIDACTLNLVQATKTGVMRKRFAQR